MGSGSAVRRSGMRQAWWWGAWIATALVAVVSLSCVRYARFHGSSARTGTCEGACHHYVSCKDEHGPDAFRSCVAECQEIFVDQGETDEDSLMVFEGLDCKATVAFVDGNDDGRNGAAASRRAVKGRSQAH